MLKATGFPGSGVDCLGQSLTIHAYGSQHRACTPPFRSALRAGALFSLLTAVTTLTAEFPLKDGDTWVMAGDSITAQHLHSNYYEAYCFARYPKL